MPLWLTVVCLAVAGLTAAYLLWAMLFPERV